MILSLKFHVNDRSQVLLVNLPKFKDTRFTTFQSAVNIYRSWISFDFLYVLTVLLTVGQNDICFLNGTYEKCNFKINFNLPRYSCVCILRIIYKTNCSQILKWSSFYFYLSHKTSTMINMTCNVSVTSVLWHCEMI